MLKDPSQRTKQHKYLKEAKPVCDHGYGVLGERDGVCHEVEPYRGLARFWEGEA